MTKLGWSARKWRDGKFHAAVKKFERYHYGKHTAYGERTVWKERKDIDAGVFATRPEAIAAAKALIKKINDDNAALQSRPGPSIPEINAALDKLKKEFDGAGMPMKVNHLELPTRPKGVRS